VSGVSHGLGLGLGFSHIVELWFFAFAGMIVRSSYSPVMFFFLPVASIVSTSQYNTSHRSDAKKPFSDIFAVIGACN